VVATTNSISNNYDVVPIFNSIRKILLLILSVELMKGQSTFMTSYMGP